MTLEVRRVVTGHDANGKAPFLMETTMLAEGEELCAITRVDTTKAAVPGKVIVTAMVDGKPITKDLAVMNVNDALPAVPEAGVAVTVTLLASRGGRCARRAPTPRSAAR